MKIAAAVVFIGLSFPLFLHAQSAPVKFKGNSLGMSLEDFKKINRGGLAWVSGADPSRGVINSQPRVVHTPVCSDTAVSFPGSDARRVEGEVVCNISPGDLNVEARTVNGLLIDQILYRFYQGKLYRIDLAFTFGGYAQVKEALISQFGQPSTTGSTDYQNSTGAQWKGEKLSWNSGTSTSVSLLQGAGNGPAPDRSASASASIADSSLAPGAAPQ